MVPHHAFGRVGGHPSYGSLDLERVDEPHLREGSAVISHHNGWLARIDLLHPNFPGPYDSVGLYVSDECAGVHEMIFLSTLVMMTDGVPQRTKLKAVAVMCSIVYVLNILRLVVFYPIAVDACMESPNVQACLTPMWQWHEAVYTWGFLAVLVAMWLVWFIRFGGPARTLAATKDDPSPWRFQRRRVWETKHKAVLGAALLLFVLAMTNISTNQEAIDSDTLANLPVPRGAQRSANLPVLFFRVR